VGSFKAALVALDARKVPDWLVDKLQSENVDLVVKNCLSAPEFLACAGDADLVWVFGGNKFVSPENLGPLLPQLERCGAILRTGSGTDNVPVERATQLGIIVANTPEAIADNVADHAIGLIFAVIRQIALHARLVREGVWDRSQGWPNWHLSGQTLGLVGFGHIGQLVARKMSGFEMKILVYDPVVNEEVIRKLHCHPSTLDDLLRQSDYVSLHCPLTKGTRHLLGEREFAMMKKSAVFVNTTRGGVVNEQALLRALTEGWIAAAGLDVLESEPPPADHPLLKLPNTVITPHIAGYSDGSEDTFWRDSVQVVLDFAGGRWPRWVVNRDVKPRWSLKTN
jgi:D-3-phosphoglycerate dehydrogenase